MNKVPADLTDWMDQLSQDRDEWRGALFDILREHGPEAVRALLRDLQNYGLDLGVVLSEAPLNTPYINTIALSEQPAYPGDIELEKRLENIIRWNAAAMVLRAQDSGDGLGGHIATYASAATALETGFNHVFRADTDILLPQP
ncbi:MAG: pyruvate dehydrogenase (acetyl-transferring), homodimeric type, partial [Pseudomonadota bacterium]